MGTAALPPLVPMPREVNLGPLVRQCRESSATLAHAKKPRQRRWRTFRPTAIPSGSGQRAETASLVAPGSSPFRGRGCWLARIAQQVASRTGA